MTYFSTCALFLNSCFLFQFETYFSACDLFFSSWIIFQLVTYISTCELLSTCDLFFSSWIILQLVNYFSTHELSGYEWTRKRPNQCSSMQQLRSLPRMKDTAWSNHSLKTPKNRTSCIWVAEVKKSEKFMSGKHSHGDHFTGWNQYGKVTSKGRWRSHFSEQPPSQFSCIDVEHGP